MNVSAFGGVTLLAVNVNPQISNAKGLQEVSESASSQLRRYAEEAGIRTRTRLLAHHLKTWFKDVSGGELHEGNVVMEESIEGVRWQILADYYLQRKRAAADKSESQEQEDKLRLYVLLSKGASITTDDYLNREKVKLGFPENELWGVEKTSVSPMQRSGFRYGNGVRVVFGRHFIAHNRSPLNRHSRNRLQKLCGQLARMREVLTNNAHAVERREWGIVRRNKEEMSRFLSMLRADNHFELPNELSTDWLRRLGDSNSMESATNAGAFDLFAALIVACCGILKVCYFTRCMFLEVQRLIDQQLSITVFREKIASIKFGEDYGSDEFLMKAGNDFRSKVEEAQGVINLEHAYLMEMDDSTCGIFRPPARKYKAGDMYKLSMEKLSKTNLKLKDDECVAFGKDVVSIKVMGKRVIRTHEEQMVEAKDAFGYINYLGSIHSKAAVMLAILNIIKASKNGGPIFDKFVFPKEWDDICTATSFDEGEFTQVILDFFPKKMSECNRITRKNITCLYPSAIYLAMVTKAQIQRPTVKKQNSCWLWQTTEVQVSDETESGEIIADEPLYMPYIAVSKFGGTASHKEAMELSGSWHLVERVTDSPLLHVAGRLSTLSPSEIVEKIEVHGALLSGEGDRVT